MKKISRMIWWVLPCAVALLGSVAVGAMVSRSLPVADPGLPLLANPVIAANGTTPFLQGRNLTAKETTGLVVPEHELVGDSDSDNAASGKGGTQAGTDTTAPGDSEAQGSESQPGQDGQSEDGIAPTTTPTTLKPSPPVVIPIGPGDDEGGKSGSGNHQHAGDD
ncbi:MAG: hypothetical protein WCO31_05580 [Actinomycetes bacterium]